MNNTIEANPGSGTQDNDSNTEIRDLERLLVQTHLVFFPSNIEDLINQRENPKFLYNDRVKIVGLCNQIQLNGKYGRIRERIDGQLYRWKVMIEDLSTSSPLVSIHEKHLVKAKENPSNEKCVLLHSLRQHKDLNGQSTHVISSDSGDSSRVIVRTTNNTYLSVPIDCTLLLPHNTFLLSGENRTNSCCICLQADAVMTAADPCGHASVCEECSHQFAINAPCPVCREPVSKYLKVYW